MFVCILIIVYYISTYAEFTQTKTNSADITFHVHKLPRKYFALNFLLCQAVGKFIQISM